MPDAAPVMRAVEPGAKTDDWDMLYGDVCEVES
jgi:hypothetical protein